MRFASYNILTGGIDGTDASRLERVIEVVRTIDPDVLAVQEANGFAEDKALRRRFERETGLKGHICRTRSGHHVALFIKPGITVEKRGRTIAGFHHGAAYADIRLADGMKLRVVTAHLAPFDGDQRLAEARTLLRRIAVGANVVLMGDLNSLDSSRDHTAALARLDPAARERYLVPGTTKADTRVVDLITASGLVDLLATAEPGVYEATVPTAFGGGEFALLRLDFIFASATIAKRLKAAGVFRAAAAAVSSDHFPTTAELDI